MIWSSRDGLAGGAVCAEAAVASSSKARARKRARLLSMGRPLVVGRPRRAGGRAPHIMKARASSRRGEGGAEEADQPLVEKGKVLRLADAVPLIGEKQRLVRNARRLQRRLDGMQVLGRDIRIVHALHDEEPRLDARDEMDGRALAIALRHLLGAAAQHLLDVGAEVGTGRAVVD